MSLGCSADAYEDLERALALHTRKYSAFQVACVLLLDGRRPGWHPNVTPVVTAETFTPASRAAVGKSIVAPYGKLSRRLSVSSRRLQPSPELLHGSIRAARSRTRRLHRRTLSGRASG